MDQTREKLFEALIDEMYDAAAQPDDWTRVWQAIVAAFGGTSGALSLFPTGGGPPTHLSLPGFSAEAIQLYEEYYHRFDVWGIQAMRRGSGTAFLSEDFLSAADYANSEMWTDYARPQLDAFHALGVAVTHERLGAWNAGIHRPKGAPAFNEADRHAFNLLLPHLRRSLRMHKLLAETRLRAEIGFSALDRIAAGVLIVAAEGDVIFANAAAEALAADRDALILGGRLRGLEAVRPADTRALRDAVRSAALLGQGGAVQLQRASGGRPLAALIARLPRRLADTGQGRGLAIVILHDLGAGVAPTHGALRQLFGATPAEADLALALLAGYRLDEIAELRGTVISTLRSQLSALLARTGSRRQSDLMRLLAQLTPPREDG